MKVSKWGKDKLFISLIGLTSILFVVLVSNLTQFCCFLGDDFWFARCFNLQDVFVTLHFERGGHGGGYLGYFLCKFFSFVLPIILNIHPIDFIGTYHSVIKGIFLFVMLLLHSRFSVFHNRSKWLYFFTMLFACIYFFFYSQYTNILRVSYSYYRYAFSLIFFFIFWYYIYKNIIVDYKKLNIPQFILACFCAYVVGTSLEILSIGSLILSGLLILYNVVIFLVSKKKTINLKSLRFNLNYKFFVPIGILCTAVYLFTSSIDFKNVATSRGVGNINITKELLTNFFNVYWYNCIQNIWIYWVLFIIVLIISLFFAIKKNEIKKIIFPIFFQLATLLIMYSLILCGKTFVSDNGITFWIEHTNILFTYKMMILCPIFILIGYIYKNIRKNNLIKIFVYVLFIIFTLLFIFNKNFNKDHYKDIYEEKREEYIAEKMMRFYYLKNEIPIIRTNSYVNIGENGEKYNLNSLDKSEHHKKLFLTSMDLVYGDNLATTLGVIIQENALEEFYEKGGSFTDEELKELKFEKLKDNNFVLNKA